MKRWWISILTSVALAVVALKLAVAVMSALAADTDIVISEVMYNAVSEPSGEWIEIYNKGSTVVDLNRWNVSDNNVTDTITTAICPGGSCLIPAGECWLIARSQADLQNEFDNYTSPLSPTVDTSRTIFLNKKIGDGLANSTDNVILMNSSNGNVDCVSWASVTGTVCSSLTYISGSNGADTNLNGAGNGQAISNIQGSWYEHRPNGSPYNCSNTASGGGPTAITLSSLSTRSRQSTTLTECTRDEPFRWPITALGGVGLVAIGVSLIALRRRRVA